MCQSGVCPSSERLHMTDSKSFKWDICAWCHFSTQQISRSIWSVRTDNSFQRSHHKLPTKSVITPARPRRAVEMTNELRDGKLVWVGGESRVWSQRRNVFFFFFLPTFFLFVVPTLNTATLIRRNCRGITHVKEANLINSLFYVLCVLPLCTWLLWKDGSFAKRTKEPLENLFFIYINRNKINMPVQMLTALSSEVQHITVNININIHHYGDWKRLSGCCMGGLTGFTGFIIGPRSSTPPITSLINSFRSLALTVVE